MAAVPAVPESLATCPGHRGGAGHEARAGQALKSVGVFMTSRDGIQPVGRAAQRDANARAQRAHRPGWSQGASPFQPVLDLLQAPALIDELSQPELGGPQQDPVDAGESDHALALEFCQWCS